jgi:hypothetical protein
MEYWMQSMNPNQAGCTLQRNIMDWLIVCLTANFMRHLSKVQSFIDMQLKYYIDHENYHTILPPIFFIDPRFSKFDSKGCIGSIGSQKLLHNPQG